MDHRHLTPQEIDLLVDGEEGFGIAPLAAHIEECVTCRTELEAQQELVGSLEQLPHFTPSPLFAYRVMREVQVFEPWHVAAMNSVQRFIPRSRPARVLAAGRRRRGCRDPHRSRPSGSPVALDAVVFLCTSVGVERMRGVGNVGRRAPLSVRRWATRVGLEPANVAMLVATGFLTTVAISAFGLRALAAASRRRRM